MVRIRSSYSILRGVVLRTIYCYRTRTNQTRGYDKRRRRKDLQTIRSDNFIDLDTTNIFDGTKKHQHFHFSFQHRLDGVWNVEHLTLKPQNPKTPKPLLWFGILKIHTISKYTDTNLNRYLNLEWYTSLLVSELPNEKYLHP